MHRRRIDLNALFLSIDEKRKKESSNDKFRQLVTRIENKEYQSRGAGKIEKSNELTWDNVKVEIYSMKDFLNINKMTTRILSQVAKEYSIDLPKPHGTMKKEIYIEALKNKGLSLSDVVNKIVSIKTHNTDISKLAEGPDSDSTKENQTCIEANCDTKSDPGDTAP